MSTKRFEPPSSAVWSAVADDRVEARSGPLRHYRRDEAIVFLKTREEFGGLSNMAGGFPLRVNGAEIRTSEALYQACRFPDRPDVQREILKQRSPMTAKMKSKPHRGCTRPDWNRVRVRVMRWCLRVKLAQNWDTFSGLLESTGNLPIVEESRRDTFWGAKPDGDHRLVGMNVLGRLLMELRKKAREGGVEAFHHIAPPELDHFRLLGRPVEPVAGLQPIVESDALRAASVDWGTSHTSSRAGSHALAPTKTPNVGCAGSDRDLITRILLMVREHPVSRPEIDAMLGPLLTVSLSEREKRKQIGRHLRSLRRGGWIVFHKDDRRWKLGNRPALLDPDDTPKYRGPTLGSP